MHKIVLAGKYPNNTFEKLKSILTDDSINLIKIDDEDEYKNMEDAEIIILRIFKAPKKIIDNNKNLRMIMRWGTGYDSVDVEYASEKGIIVTNTPGANAVAVAELTTMLMLAISRKLFAHQEYLNRGIWSKNTFINESYTLNNKTVGLIGAGNIGRRVAKYVQAFGAKTQYYDIYRLNEKMEKEFNLEFKDLNELLQSSDIITLHIPLTEENYHIIDENQINMMKDNAIIINTSRGGLINDKALLNAIKSGKLLGAGLDVVENEPLSKDDELILNPNIIVTPHIGGATADIGDVIIPMIVENINNYIKGKEIKYVVNKDLLN